MFTWLAANADTSLSIEQALARRIRRAVRWVALLSVFAVSFATLLELRVVTGANASQRSSRFVLLFVVLAAARLVREGAPPLRVMAIGMFFPTAGVVHALYTIATSGGGASTEIAIFPITVVASTFIMVVPRRVSAAAYLCFLAAYLTVVFRFTPDDAPAWAIPNAIRWGVLGTVLSVIGNWLGYGAANDALQGRIALREESQRAALAVERTRLSRDLHDHIGARLVGLALRAERDRKHMPPEARDSLAWMQQTAGLCLEELRDTIWALSNAAQDAQAFAAMLRRRAEDIATASGIALSWDVDLASFQGELRPGVSVTLSSVLREAMTNAVRHSGATSVQVELRRKDDTWRLAISDDGKGFDAGREEGRGIANMRARAAEERADLRIERNAQGGVTVALTYV